MSDDNVIQFISAEELRRVAVLEKDDRKMRTTDGMIDMMDATIKQIDKLMRESGTPSLMMQWAVKDPGAFFNLSAKLKMHNKGSQQNVRIQLGLPSTSLDE